MWYFTTAQLSSDEVNPVQLVVLAGRGEEGRGVLRLRERLGGLGRLFVLFSRRMRLSVMSLAFRAKRVS
jgi:hypothetical protein